MKHKKRFIIITMLAVILVIAFFLGNRITSTRSELHKRTRFIMDTYFTIQAYGKKKEIDKAMDMAFMKIEEIDKKFNFRNMESPLYNFNNSWSQVTDEEIIYVVKTAQQISRNTNGAFDITIFPVLDLWGFSRKNPAIPARSAINSALKKIGYRNLIIKDNKLIKLKSFIQVDLGGIAKGYAIGEAVNVLKAQGINSALVDGGGDLYTLGKVMGKPWMVGIRNPRGEGVIGGIEISDLAVVTSGDYERYFMNSGKRYHHIIDPNTGYPAKGLISVTVFTWSPIIADAWSTALFVMGPEKGFALAEKTRDIETLMITEDGNILISSGLKDNLEIEKEKGLNEH